MNLRALTFGAWLFACGIGWAAPTRAALDEPNREDPLCDEETVYGTVVLIDEALGVFGLLGTRYKFQSMQELDLHLLQGRMVKIDIGPDCGIEDLHVLDGDSESIT